MSLTTRFVMLVERAARSDRRTMFKAGAALLLSAALLSATPSLRAQTASSKVAADLQQVLSAASTPKLSWAKDVDGVRMVKVLIVSNSLDPDLTALRGDVVARGGAVYFRYVSVAALSAMLPAIGRQASVAS